VRGGFIRYRDEAVPDVEGGRLRRRRPEPDDAEECFRPAEQVPDERGTYAATTFRRADVEMPQPSDLVAVRKRIAVQPAHREEAIGSERTDEQLARLVEHVCAGMPFGD
jgi:hypothetical protein